MQKFLYIIFISLVLVIVSCSSTKQSEKPKTETKIEKVKPLESKIPVLKDFNSSIKNLIIEGEIDIDSPQLDNSADFELTICGSDSLSMIISGPLGITVAKLFATKNQFIFINSFSGELYKGKPTKENFEKVANIPLSFNDLINILQSKLLYHVKQYKYIKLYEDNYVFMINNNEIFDEILINQELNKILYLKRFNSTKELFNCSYGDFININNNNNFIAKTITINAPNSNIKLKIKYDKVQANVTIDKPISFKIPNKIKTFILD